MTGRRLGRVMVGTVAASCLVLAGWARVNNHDGPHGAQSVRDSDPEAGFARDMSVHHAQGVAIAEAVRSRTDETDIRLLATDIALTQQAQIGRFLGWLDVWGLSATNSEPMAWMPAHGAASMPMPMPGMATPAEVLALSTLPTDEAEEQFLRLMIRHHRGAIRMAQAILDLTKREEVVSIAEAMVTSQRAEIQMMNEMLNARGRSSDPTESTSAAGRTPIHGTE